jgi:hypothetical protein
VNIQLNQNHNSTVYLRNFQVNFYQWLNLKKFFINLSYFRPILKKIVSFAYKIAKFNDKY